MQHLQELGMDLKGTMMYWVFYKAGHENNFVTTKENAMEIIDESCGMLPTYALQDVLDALPKSVISNGKYYFLTLDLDSENIYYGTNFGTDLLKGIIYRKHGCLIDAAYEMLCWCIENKYVETNKNE